MKLSPEAQRHVTTTSVLAEVAGERERQDQLWGEQNHGFTVWQGILGEEVGEVSKAINDHYFSGGPVSNIREELIQVAAVAVAIVEYIDRKGLP